MRLTIRTAGCAAALLVLTSCTPTGVGSTDPALSAAPSSASSAPTDTAPTDPSATDPAPSSSGLSSATPASTTTPATRTCDTADLRVTYVDDAGGGAAGSTYGKLTFRNVSTVACSLKGFPGVSYVGDDNGTQIGGSARRTTDPVTAVALAADQTAYAVLQRTSPGPYGDECSTHAVDGFRVYPPAAKKSVFVRFAAQGCQNSAIRLLTVGPVTRAG